MERSSPKWLSNTRSATSAAARKACRCSWKNSSATSDCVLPRNAARRFSSTAWTRAGWTPRPSTNSSTFSPTRDPRMKGNKQMRRVVVLAAVLALPAYALADALQPGMYRVTSQSPGEKPETSEQCISQKDIDESLSALGEKDPNCKVLDMKRGASEASYRTVCAANGMKVSTQAKFTFTRDSFDGQLNVDISGAPSGAKENGGKIHMAGKRIGACRK